MYSSFGPWNPRWIRAWELSRKPKVFAQIIEIGDFKSWNLKKGLLSYLKLKEQKTVSTAWSTRLLKMSFCLSVLTVFTAYIFHITKSGLEFFGHILEL